MNILYLSSSPRMRLSDCRGYSTHITETIAAFKQIGHNVLPLTGGNSTPGRVNLSVVKKFKATLPGRVNEIIRMFYDTYSDWQYFSCAQKAFQSFAPEVIYERYVVLHRSGVKLSKKYNLPIILEVNSPMSERDLHYGTRQRFFLKKIEKKMFLSVNAIIVVSNVLKNHLIDAGIPAAKINAIPNAVDHTRFNPAISGVEVKKRYGIKHELVVGFVGGFSKWHGIDSLLLVVPEIIKKVHARFLLVGDGTMRQEAEKFVKNNGMAKYVIFAGSVPYPEIPQYIAAMDLTIMPASNSYGSPIKIFEYLAMGKPVIAPKVGPVEDVIENNKDGILIKPGDMDQIREAILFLSDNLEYAKQLAENGRQKVLKNNTWYRNADRITQIFTECLIQYHR